MVAATKILKTKNVEISDETHLTMHFSKVWIHRFQNFHKIWSLNLFEESYDLDQVVLGISLLALKPQLKGYILAYQFNKN